MFRACICFCALALIGAQPLVGQEPPQPNLVYEAYYRVDFDDLDEWNRRYWAYSVPVLEELREEGVIEGWSHSQHQTGGDGYNVRFTARTYDWGAIETFWSEYFSRLQAVTPAAEWADGGRLIAEHRDAIWDIEEVTFVDEPEFTHVYISTFRLNFADMGEWDEMWTDVAAPILAEAMSEGILTGWVKLGHNTGGPHNSKVLYFFNGWDQIDDLFAKLIGTMAEAHPDQFARINEMIRAHDDFIWAPTTQDEM
jgi:hypothetical protein